MTGKDTADDRTTREAAEIALQAFDADSPRIWIRNWEICQKPANTPLGRLLTALRKAWWHGGTYKQREHVHVCVARLRFRLQWEDEQQEKKRAA